MCTDKIKLQSYYLSNSIQRNINNNFDSISFEELSSGDIQVKIVVTTVNDEINEMIDDIMVEYESVQEDNIILKPIVSTNTETDTLKYVIYKKTHN